MSIYDFLKKRVAAFNHSTLFFTLRVQFAEILGNS